jgi:hypothetical protein
VPHTPLLHVATVLPPPAGHVVHAAPPVPHVDGDSDAHGTQAPPLQQPLGHEVASQTQALADWLHSSPWPQALHVAPPVPHDVLFCDVYGSHVPVGPPLQQPFGHEVASHTQPCDDLLHSRPDAHVVHDEPLAPHCVFVSLA